MSLPFMRIAPVVLITLTAGPAAAAAPKLSPAPWVDGETFWYATRPLETPTPTPSATPTATPGGAPGNEVFRFGSAGRPIPALRIDAVTREGGQTVFRSHAIRSGWSYHGLGVDLALLSSEIRTMHVDSETLAPASFALRDTAGEVRARYGGGKVEVVGRDGKTTYYDLLEAAFDSSELPFVLRRLPLDDGYVGTFSMFTGRVGVYPAKVEVVARETVTVPAGTFACFKVRVTDGRSSGEAFYWISTDAHRYLVREESASLSVGLSGGIIELTQIARWGEATPMSYRDEHWNLAFTLPAGWVAAPPYPIGKLALGVRAASADGDVQCTLQLEDFLLLLPARPTTPPVGWRPEKPRALAEREVKARTRAFPSYAVRADSWAEATLSGRPAARYTADVTPRSGGGAMVDYVTCASQPVRVVVGCMSAQAGFQKRKAEMDALLDSLRLP